MMRPPAHMFAVAILVLGLVAPASGHDSRAGWSLDFTQSEDARSTDVHLSFGGPEPVASPFNAFCKAGVQGPAVSVRLDLGVDGRSNGETIVVEFVSNGFDADYSGTVSGSERAETVLNVGIDDPLWDVLARNDTIAFGGTGQPMTAISLKGSADPVRAFVDACRTRFAAYDSSVGPTDLQIVDYACEDGTALKVTYDNSRSYSVAQVTYGTMSQVPLIQVVSGSGARYSNGDATLHTKADSAFISVGGEEHRCTEG